MTELIRHPDKMSKAKAQLRAVVGDKTLIEDSDISRLPYLQAVIKESFRLHPPVPLAFVRSLDQDTEIGGYCIPKGTLMMCNIWSMSRDPSVWPNPESFEPERFLDMKTDSEGHSFPVVGFGAGKRVCPAKPLAQRMLHTMVGALIHNFDWEFAEGEEDRNGSLFNKGALDREAPLKAIPKKP